jgi:PAS domain S-box-containing protein
MRTEVIARPFLKVDFRRLSRYSWLIILVGTLIISGIWSFAYRQINYDYDRTIKEASRETMNLSIAFEEHVRRIISDIDKELISIKQVYERSNFSDSALSAYIREAVSRSDGQKAIVMNERGNVVAAYSEYGLISNVSDQEYFQVHLTGDPNKLYIGKPIDGNGGEALIPLARRINKPDGSFGGIAVINLRVAYFLECYQKIDIRQNNSLSVIGKDGVIRARRSNGKLGSGQDIRESNLWKSAQNSPYGTIIGKNYVDGNARLASYRVMPDYPLIVSIAVSTQLALADHEKRKWDYILGASLASIFIVAFLGLLINCAARQNALTRELEILVEERTKELQKQYAMLQERDKELYQLNCELIETSAAVQAEKERLSSLVCSISDEVWFVDMEKRVTLVNPTALKEFGLKDGEMDLMELALSLEIMRADGSRRPLDEAPPLYALQGRSGNYQEIVRTPATGELRYREVRSNPVRDISGNIIGAVSIVRDITDRKAMEDELKKHRDDLQLLVEEQLQKIREINTEMTAIFESISDPFYVLDKDGRLTYINKEAAQVNLKLNEAHIGQKIWELFPELIGSELYESYYEACTNEIPKHLVFQSIDGQKLFDAHLYPYENGLFAYFRDATEQKKYETELSRLERLNAVGEIAASIGHEVRNPMTTVRGYLQRFTQKAAFKEYQAQLMLMIEELDRANNIITEFLSLTKTKTNQMKLCDLNMVIRNLFPLVQADAFRRGNTIELQLEEIPEVVMDDKEIRQCILNLVGNGLDAMPKGGKVTIGTAQLGNHVVLTVRDRGLGIPSHIKEKLGTPFFTTKEHGTGLGLSVCYRIAQRHKASIKIETGPEGTLFYFIFNTVPVQYLSSNSL